MLLLSTRCSGSDDALPLDRAEQSSTHNNLTASGAVDGDLTTRSRAKREDPAWWRVYFKSSSTVSKVVVEKGNSYSTTCVYAVSVYDGETETVCGTYTGKSG